MDMADRNGVDLSRVLRSTERLSELAIAFGPRRKTLASRSMALLCFVTYADQRRTAVRFPVTGRPGAGRRRRLRAVGMAYLPARPRRLRRAAARFACVES